MRLTRKEKKIIDDVYSEVSTNFQKDFNIEMLPEKYGMRKSRLVAAFRDRYHVTIYAFRLESCMYYAKEKLTEGALVKEVAIELGYSTSGSFNRAFRKIFNKPPSDFLYGE